MFVETLSRSTVTEQNTKHSVIEANSSNSRTVAAKYAKLIFFLAIALLIAIRIPSIWSKGRFWAEEGEVFFAEAWHLPWYQVLFISYGGYLNIAANFAAILASSLVPLPLAPYVSTIFAFSIQLLPPSLLCLSTQNWLQDKKILLAALLIISTLPLSQEVWLSSISSQCHLSLCAGLILGLQTESGFTAIYQCILLFVAALSGPGASLLLPLFIARSFVDHSKTRVIQSLVLGTATALQLFLFYRPEERHLGVDPILLVYIFFVKHLLEPFLGQRDSEYFMRPLHHAFAQGHFSNILILATIAIFVIFFTAIWRNKRPEPIWLFLSGILMSTLSYCGALGDRTEFLITGAGNRYVFAPQILFELSLLSLSCLSHGWTRLVSRSLIAWLIVIGLHEYFYTPEAFTTGPSWRSEVREWHKDPNHKLAIWPKPWHVTLQVKNDSN